MTTTATDGECAGIGVGERIDLVTLVTGALGRVRGRRGVLAAAWLALGVADIGLDLAAQSVGIDPSSRASSADWPLYALADSALDGFSAATFLRLLVHGRFWLDRGFFECASLFALSAGAIMMTMGGLAGLDLTLGLFLLTAVVAEACIGLKLVLWPLARLEGRGGMTPVRSWVLMRRATPGLFLANLLFMIPVIALSLALDSIVADGSLGDTVLDAIIWQAYAILGAALAATVYTLRVEHPATVAEVFD